MVWCRLTITSCSCLNDIIEGIYESMATSFDETENFFAWIPNRKGYLNRHDMNIPMTLNIMECFRYAPHFNLTCWYFVKINTYYILHAWQLWASNARESIFSVVPIQIYIHAVDDGRWLGFSWFILNPGPFKISPGHRLAFISHRDWQDLRCWNHRSLHELAPTSNSTTS